MNYCHRCQSHYEKPGTCNCFAEKQPAEVLPPTTYPWVHPIYIPFSPWTWPYPGTAPYEPYRITWGGNDVPATTSVYTNNPNGTTWYAVPNHLPNGPVCIYGNSSGAA